MTNEELLQIIEQATIDKYTYLDLRNKQLTELPPQIGQLTNLTSLDIRNNQLTKLPPQIDQLTKLTSLKLSDNQLTELPPQIGQLTKLISLRLSNNKLTELPPQIGQLTKLTSLDLRNNQLTELPPQIGQLTKLTSLNLRNNQLTELSSQIGQLTNLTYLDLRNNQLTELPPQIGQLTNLTSLNLMMNQLTELPPQIGQLTNLISFNLMMNQLTELPPQIGQLTNLTSLDLYRNQLTELPPQTGQLTNLTSLDISNNPLVNPPQAIIRQGTRAILAHLQGQLKKSKRQWVSKLLVVGEGGVGKTYMLKNLRGEGAVETSPTTHGIEIGQLEIVHPDIDDVTMRLTSWDFGGQEIYHATHQFFLTNRSLFLLVWNARHGFEQGKLYYWLDTIQALAPDSPVIIVATHIDERDPDIPLTELHRKYPQIIKQCVISNTNGKGINKLKQEIAITAAELPLMGEKWPADWLDVANAVRANENKHINSRQMQQLMFEYKLSARDVPVLTQWLHDLGNILYFQNNDELKDIVIIKPQWVTEYISKVLESEEVIKKSGIFTRTHMNELWYDVDSDIRDHFLNLMEEFDLSYKILDDKFDRSLVVERMPLDPPDYADQWQATKENEECLEIGMKFELNTIPAGIPTWFIARTHRFSTHTHWRNGVLFADNDKIHLALVQAFPHDRYLQLIVRGPNPHNFFAILKDGIEFVLKRFSGMKIERKIPCLGHNGDSCPQEFDYEQLLKRIRKKPTIECPESMEDVSVVELLYGFDINTQDDVLKRLDKLQETADKIDENTEKTTRELKQLRELSQRNFTAIFNAMQSKPESECPNVFVFRPRETNSWQKNIIGQQIDLQLYCQAPGQWHPTEKDGLYRINNPAEWIKATVPYVRELIKILKFTTPFISPVLGVAFTDDYSNIIQNDLDLTEQLIGILPDLEEVDELIFRERDTEEFDRAEGYALRAFRQLLDKLDPSQKWGQLKKILTPEGHYLWLCDTHAAYYKR